MNFLIKDCNRDILSNLKSYLKEMNSLVMLLTNVNGPSISHNDVVIQNGLASFEKEEGGYGVIFNAILSADEISKASFKMRHNGRFLAELNHSIRADFPVIMEILLDCDSELVIKKELERTFAKDIFFESEQVIAGKDVIVSIAPGNPIINETEPPINHNAPADTSDSPTNNSITIAVNDLSSRVAGSILDTKLILAELDAICHDLTRGSAGSFKSKPTQIETLENSATVEFIDFINDPYQITFRKGILEGNIEISFFLERDNELVFSVYIASDGNCQITAEGIRAEATTIFVKEYLER